MDSLSISQSDASQKLVKAGELNERLRQDNKKKTDQIEKYQRDTRFLEDRLRNLEIRGKGKECILKIIFRHAPMQKNTYRILIFQKFTNVLNLCCLVKYDFID